MPDHKTSLGEQLLNPKDESNSLQAVIADELWRWVFPGEEERSAITPLESRLPISSVIGCYLTGVLHGSDFARSRNIWCDGVIEMTFTRINRRAFLITGVAYGPIELAPFEIEFHFARRRDRVPVREVVRFGERDYDGEIKWHTKARKAPTIVANRPQCDDDWAIVVEVTSNEPGRSGCA